ncbi:uncharacterized protein AB675_8611 [Cyphellophora attinorum]|uniref:Protein CSN12 homolog n=1 Tax=Cyphellophora attinorum TaxID=1664694 RepID=A0A0N1H9I8_9EURO|nr:uncharacterized protein AB675_8611 [Phialophora attinorum]KPI44322.1 hypothetical protein AB675_8611 [Phialophora attinorum]
MAEIFYDFRDAQKAGNGILLARCLAPINTSQQPRRLASFSQLTNWQSVQSDIRQYLLGASSNVKLPKDQGSAWVDIFVDLWTCIRELASIEAGVGGDWSKAFNAYKDLCNHLVRGYTNNGFPAWTIPCLQTTGQYLRRIAIRADRESRNVDGNDIADGLSDDIIKTQKNEYLEQAAWVINRMFSICLSDRSDLSESRKWGIYSTTNLLFKTYFKLNSISLNKNVIRALDVAAPDLPPINLFPRPQQCTFRYYRGVIDFLQEKYADAEEHLTQALSLCYKHSTHNREQILTYLIPAHVINTNQLPTKAFLSKQPTISILFQPLFKAIKQGNLHAFDVALSEAEGELVRRRIYLTMERTRELCMRNLFRNVFLCAGFEDNKDAKGQPIRRTRLKMEEFEAAVKVAYRGSEDTLIERDEVECFLANMIYKNFIKGYIARDRGIVVLSKAGAFPGTGV